MHGRRECCARAVASRKNCAVIELEKKLGFTARPMPDEAELVLLQRKLD